MFKKITVFLEQIIEVNGKMSYLHENINDLKITLFASHEPK